MLLGLRVIGIPPSLCIVGELDDLQLTVGAQQTRNPASKASPKTFLRRGSKAIFEALEKASEGVARGQQRLATRRIELRHRLHGDYLQGIA